MTSFSLLSGRARRHGLGVAVVAAGLLRVAPCVAQEVSAAPANTSTSARTKAAELFARGKAAYGRADYEAALVDLRASYELVPAPALLFNIAQALRMAGQCEEAAEQYRRYRDAGLELPSDFDELYGQALGCAEAQRSAKERAARQSASDDSPERGAVPSNAASDERTRATEKPQVADVPAREPHVALASAAPSSSVGESEQAGSYQRPAGLACFAVSAASAIAGTVFVVRAHEAETQMEELSRTRGAEWDASGADTQQAGRTSKLWATGLYVVSGVAAGTGLWFWLSAPSHDAAGVALSVSPNALGVSTSVRASF